MSEGVSGRTRRKAGWIFWAAILPVSILAGFLLRWGEGNLPPAANVALLLGILALAYVGSVRWWATLDFMQKDAQLTAWYWGGTVGGTIMLVALLLWSGKGPAMFGAALMLGGQAAGFVAFWLLWRIRYRGRSA